jgi:hypothetical protein
MAPPQVIISQPTPQQDNSLLSYFITSRMLNESNMLNSRTSTHQANIRDKRKEFTRIITTKTTSPQAKEDAQNQFKKTNYVFKPKSNAGRPPNQPSK